MAWRLGVLAVVGILAAAGCRQAAPDTPRPEGQVVNVVASEFVFAPKEISVKTGRVRFLVKNTGTVEHDFTIVGVAEHGGAHGTETFQPGETYTVDVALKPGTYQIECGVTGHKEAGMIASLVVVP